MHIKVDDLSGPEIQALLANHLKSMYETSPAESVHALDLDGLRQPGVTCWSLWLEDRLAGCGALKQLDAGHGEIKSMRTHADYLRRNVAASLLAHILEEARVRGYSRLSLETGSMAYFAPARSLYEKFGFEYCGPFDDYCEDPNSVFMTLNL